MTRGAVLLAAVALAPGCGDAARALSAGPAGRAAATALVDALRSRYGVIEREPAYEAVRPKLAAAVLVPSRAFDDRSVWTAAEGEWRGLWLEGRGGPGAYRVGIRPAPPAPSETGEYRGRLTLHRLESGRFEWTTQEALALGPIRPEELVAALRALLRAAESQAMPGARPPGSESMPRSARAFGRLFDLEALSLRPDPAGGVRIEVALRLQPERLKAGLPKFAAYVARYSRGLRLAATASVEDGRPLWTAEVEDTAWRLRLRSRDGRLAPLEGPSGRAGKRLRVTIDYSFKSGPFRVGVKGLAADVDLAPWSGELAFVARFVEQPDWKLPFLIEPFMRNSLRYPFEGPGSQLSLAVRPEAERSTLVAESRVRIRESWIVRWLGGFTRKALDDLRAAESEADRYVLECLTAVREDLASLAAAPGLRGARVEP